MADPSFARRCSSCDINFPDEDTYNSCLACDGSTWRVKDEVWDEDWPDKVKTLMAEYQARVIPRIPNIQSTIYRWNDLLWIAEGVLKDKGYACTDLEVVKINGKFYELAGRTVGENNIPAWWIEEIKAIWPFDLPVLSELEYIELEQRRGLRV